MFIETISEITLRALRESFAFFAVIFNTGKFYRKGREVCRKEREEIF